MWRALPFTSSALDRRVQRIRAFGFLSALVAVFSKMSPVDAIENDETDIWTGAVEAAGRVVVVVLVRRITGGLFQLELPVSSI
jgi:hypothetical protein